MEYSKDFLRTVFYIESKKRRIVKRVVSASLAVLPVVFLTSMHYSGVALPGIEHIVTNFAVCFALSYAVYSSIKVESIHHISDNNLSDREMNVFVNLFKKADSEARREAIREAFLTRLSEEEEKEKQRRRILLQDVQEEMKVLLGEESSE